MNEKFMREYPADPEARRSTLALFLATNPVSVTLRVK